MHWHCSYNPSVQHHLTRDQLNSSIEILRRAQRYCDKALLSYYYAIIIDKSCSVHWNFFSVELTFEVSLPGLLSHQGSNICKTQDHSHSDTTPLYYIYIYIYIWRNTVKNSRVQKTSIYKRVIYYYSFIYTIYNFGF